MSQVLAEPQVSLNSFIIHLKPAIDITEDQFFALCQLNRDLRLERNAEGDIIVMPPTGGETGNRNAEITGQVAGQSKMEPARCLIPRLDSNCRTARIDRPMQLGCEDQDSHSYLV